jgi:hypothetical protein
MLILGQPHHDLTTHIKAYPVMRGHRRVSTIYRGGSIWTDEDVPGNVTFTCVEDALKYITPIIEHDTAEFEQEQRS